MDNTFAIMDAENDSIKSGKKLLHLSRINDTKYIFNF